MRVIDINIDSPNDLYRGIYITKYNGICINGMKYVLNGKEDAFTFDDLFKPCVTTISLC